MFDIKIKIKSSNVQMKTKNLASNEVEIALIARNWMHC